MAILAKYTYEVRPGRVNTFLTKLMAARASKFTSPIMPKSVRLFRSLVPGPDNRYLLLIEFEDMAAYAARSQFENSNQEWREMFASNADSAERLIGVELLTES